MNHTVAVEAVAVAILTLGLVVTRPLGLNEGIAALLGAALALLLKLVSLRAAVRLETDSWNIFLFFLGMMAVAALADQSGVLDAVAAGTVRLAKGRVRTLYAAIIITGSIVSILFANDTAALVLTPIVYALVVRRSLDPLPFVFAITFIADTASILLPVSNPLNVILVDRFHLSLLQYVDHLSLPALLAITVNTIAFFVLFRRSLGGRLVPAPRAEPRRYVAVPATILALLAAGYLLATAARFPVGPVAMAGAIALAGNAARQRDLHVRRLAREISWPIFAFLAGMLIVVQCLNDVGITSEFGATIVRASAGSPVTAIAATTFGTALGSNAINNLPMALVAASALQRAHVTGALRLDMAYAAVVGCDLGPNLTHLGSLATFLWLFFLRRKGLDVSVWDYLRIGVLVTPIMLLVTVAGLWLTTGSWG